MYGGKSWSNNCSFTIWEFVKIKRMLKFISGFHPQGVKPSKGKFISTGLKWLSLVKIFLLYKKFTKQYCVLAISFCSAINFIHHREKCLLQKKVFWRNFGGFCRKGIYSIRTVCSSVRTVCSSVRTVCNSVRISAVLPERHFSRKNRAQFHKKCVQFHKKCVQFQKKCVQIR